MHSALAVLPFICKLVTTLAEPAGQPCNMPVHLAVPPVLQLSHSATPHSAVSASHGHLLLLRWVQDLTSCTLLCRGVAGYAATRQQITEAVCRDFASASEYVTIFEDLRKIHTAGLGWSIAAWSSEQRYTRYSLLMLLTGLAAAT